MTQLTSLSDTTFSQPTDSFNSFATRLLIEAEEIVVAGQRLAAEERRKAKEEEKRLRKKRTRQNRK